ncbi:sterol desaturase family protein [Flavicella sediminum]|uniref:sterol desaturase family protein n=1 Tax=Flavicella sediminum TaxID=2585141 RepID=UPI001120A1B6|nr:sterol desaturase family protein [Flavicella sediminum]
MKTYIDIFRNEFFGMTSWVWNQITFQELWYQNYFYGLIAISLVVWVLEILFPWRKEQAIIRKDFWLDVFYMFFNFFAFSIFIYGFYGIIQHSASSIGFNLNSITLIDIKKLPLGYGLLVFFILNDFVQWLTHVLLHRFDFLWQFHKVHHSVEEMGFAAHLRYHWMENLFYKPLKTLIVMFLGGFEPDMAFAIHFLSILIGHLNHANLKITWGPLKYIFNNPVMHLYHHAKALPKNRFYGVNFGISLSLWDYLFKTNYIPQSEDGTIELGFDEVENFPKKFLQQITYGFTKNASNQNHK